MMRHEIINAIAEQISAKGYLEIGVQSGENFAKVKVESKVGVDPDRHSKATEYRTSDAYFKGLSTSTRFDLVFVDGLHEQNQVVRDVVNSISHLTPGGVIVVHDCLPPSWHAAQVQDYGGAWCGTTWKGWLRLRRDLPGWTSLTVDTDLGCGVLVKGHQEVFNDLKITEQIPDDWVDFWKNRHHLLNLVSPERFLEGLSQLGVRR